MESPEDFWARCCEALGPVARRKGYGTRCIGNTPEMVDQILALIISGQKRGTFSLPGELARAGKTPGPGDYVVLTRHNGQAGCLVLVEACALVPFDQVGPAELALEGPQARDPAVWRRIHEAYWSPTLAAGGQNLTTSEPVLVQRFRLLATASRHGQC